MQKVKRQLKLIISQNVSILYYIVGFLKQNYLICYMINNLQFYRAWQ